jgi:glycosyltransferase involved in cell wall biosynthesis
MEWHWSIHEPMNNTSRSPISVVIPCYNAGAFLAEAIDSALGQSHAPREVIVVDDGSTDDSAALAERYGPPVRVIRQVNQGESTARNRGMDEAEGEWVALLDADDVWEPEKLEAQIDVARRDPDVGCIHTNFRYFGLSEEMPPVPEGVRRNDFNLATMLLRRQVKASTAMVRRSLPVQFPEWTQRAEDMIYFADLARRGIRFVYLGSVLARARQHAAQQTRNGNEGGIDHHQSRLRWLEQIAVEIEQNTYREARSALLQQMVRSGLNARGQRNWHRYWVIREYLSTYPDPEVERLVRERVYPRLVYWLKDGARRLVWSHRQSLTK